MKRLLLTAVLISSSLFSFGQAITIDSTDVPALNDTLRSSAASPVSVTVSALAQTGANTTWDFSALVPLTQTVDTYRSATSVNILYFSMAGAYGYNTSPDDLFGQPLPISIPNFYLFFQKRATSPRRFVLRGFGGEFNGIPVPAAYSDEDEWYYLPMNFGDSKSSTYKLDVSLAGDGIKIDGTRQTDVDGWGTIMTPYTTTPVNVLRVRTIGDEIDSITFSSTTTALPRKTIEYKWMAKGEHYPLLWITTNEVLGSETITSVRFRDHYRNLMSVGNVGTSYRELKAYPNPATDGVITIDVPTQWKYYTMEVIDLQGKTVIAKQNENQVQLSSLSAGQYIVRVISEGHTGFVRITK